MDTQSDGISRRTRPNSKDGSTVHPMCSPRSFSMRTGFEDCEPAAGPAP